MAIFDLPFYDSFPCPDMRIPIFRQCHGVLTKLRRSNHWGKCRRSAGRHRRLVSQDRAPCEGPAWRLVRRNRDRSGRLPAFSGRCERILSDDSRSSRKGRAEYARVVPSVMRPRPWMPVTAQVISCHSIWQTETILASVSTRKRFKCLETCNQSNSW